MRLLAAGFWLQAWGGEGVERRGCWQLASGYKSEVVSGWMAQVCLFDLWAAAGCSYLIVLFLANICLGFCRG